MDELRDYRFYKPDLIHPTAQSENHIWEKWSESFFSPISHQKIKQLSKINNDLQTGPINPQSKSHQEFLQKLLGKLERMQPEFDFSSEIQNIRVQLQAFSQLGKS